MSTTYRPPARQRHQGEGYDGALLNVLDLIIERGVAGDTDHEILTAIIDLADLRLQATSENPVELLTET